MTENNSPYSEPQPLEPVPDEVEPDEGEPLPNPYTGDVQTEDMADNVEEDQS